MMVSLAFLLRLILAALSFLLLLVPVLLVILVYFLFPVVFAFL
jgi:hypothetical protein